MRRGDRIVLASNADSIINECLDFDYTEAVSIAKAKYFYEHIESNPKAVAVFNSFTGAEQGSDQLDASYINGFKTIDVFFPLHYFVDYTLNIQTACKFGVLCEINSYLKRIVPTKVKKAKAIGTFRRDVLHVGDEGGQGDDGEDRGEDKGGEAKEEKMEEENIWHRDLDNDDQGEGDAGTIRRLAVCESSGLFRVKHMNKLYIFKKGEERLRAVGVQNNRIVFDVVATYKILN